MNPKCNVLFKETACSKYGWIIKRRKFPVSQAIIWTQAEYDDKQKGGKVESIQDVSSFCISHGWGC